MNHRERLIAALSHQQPDRVPIDIGGTVNSSIVVEGYAELKQHYGINSEDELCNRMTRVVKVDEQIDWICKHTDCAAVLAVPPPFIHLSQYLRGFEDWYCDIALGAKVFDALCDAVLDLSEQYEFARPLVYSGRRNEYDFWREYGRDQWRRL